MDKAAVTIAVLSPLMIVFHIILIFAGCVTVFYIIRGIYRIFKKHQSKIKDKLKKFGNEAANEMFERTIIRWKTALSNFNNKSAYDEIDEALKKLAISLTKEILIDLDDIKKLS